MRPRSGLTSCRRDGRPIKGVYVALSARDVQAPSGFHRPRTGAAGPDAQVRVLVAGCLECHQLMGRHVRHLECEAKLLQRYLPARIAERDRQLEKRAEQARLKLRAKAGRSEPLTGRELQRQQWAWEAQRLHRRAG